jgi:hypothetical protein
MSKRPTRQKIVEGFDLETGLPTPQQTQQTIQAIVAKSGKKTFTIHDAAEPPAREPGLTGKGRAKFTTMLKPELRQQLERIAQNRQISVADVLETIITEYLDLPPTP